MHIAVEFFLRMLEKCNSKVPEQFRDKYPGMPVRVLLMLNASPCLSQTEAARRLGIQQSRFSKLIKKLRDLHWLEAVISDEDHRFDELKITQAGKDWLDSLEPELLNLLTAGLAKHESADEE